jgi:hypothetical protein
MVYFIFNTIELRLQWAGIIMLRNYCRQKVCCLRETLALATTETSSSKTKIEQRQIGIADTIKDK